ncbi:MAG: hypothetical protein AB8F74_00005, partial [Saprospiraceae bacterium]
PAMKAPFDTLARKLREMNGDRTLLFVVNHGNWGDALIREGAEAFLKHYGFNYVSVHSNQLMDGKITVADSKRLTGGEDPLKLIYTQRWIDAFRQPWEAYALSRRTQNTPVEGDRPMHYRFSYPPSEAENNPEN